MAMHNDERRRMEQDELDRRARDARRGEGAMGKPESDEDLAAEGVGGVSGGALGAAVGSLAGPLGTAIGAIAGAVGGWWAGKAVVDAATGVSEEEEAAYRTHYETTPGRLADRGYEDVRPAYHIGRLARLNPDYSGRPFDEIDVELAQAWTPDLRVRYGEWKTVRDFAREGYMHRERHDRPGGSPRTMSPTEETLGKPRPDDSAV